MNIKEISGILLDKTDRDFDFCASMREFVTIRLSHGDDSILGGRIDISSRNSLSSVSNNGIDDNHMPIEISSFHGIKGFTNAEHNGRNICIQGLTNYFRIARVNQVFPIMKCPRVVNENIRSTKNFIHQRESLLNIVVGNITLDDIVVAGW